MQKIALELLMKLAGTLATEANIEKVMEWLLVFLKENADKVLDLLEEKAADTESSIDDTAVAMFRKLTGL